MRNNKQRRQRIREALRVLADLGMPRAQQNERSALSLLAILNITPEKGWKEAENPLIGITPIMDWIREHYKKRYAPNTRETVRRQTMHQFVQAGVSLYNPDKPDRPVNSPYAVYQIAPACLELVRSYGTELYQDQLAIYLTTYKTLAQQYARNREMAMVPLHLSESLTVPLSPGRHSELIRATWEEFG